jgi:hypothetical protein
MESQQRLKNLTPSLLWGDLAARATLGELHMMDSRLRFKNYFGQGQSFSLIFFLWLRWSKILPPRHQTRDSGKQAHRGIDIG